MNILGNVYEIFALQKCLFDVDDQQLVTWNVLLGNSCLNPFPSGCREPSRGGD